MLVPIAAWAYGWPELIGLIAILAARQLPDIQALQIVPKAQLQMQMRFARGLARAGGQPVDQMVLTIGGAYAGFGAYSFVAPVPITALVVAAATWMLARPPIGWRLAPRRWRYGFGKEAQLLAAHNCSTPLSIRLTTLRWCGSHTRVFDRCLRVCV